MTRPEDPGPDDARLERAIRDALHRQDPGPAPITVRERALRVSDTTPSRRDIRRRALSGVLGLAAVLVLAAVAIGAFGHGGRPGPAAPSLGLASPVASGAPTPGVSTSPGETTAPATAEATPFATASPIPATPGPSATPIAFATTQPGAGPSFDPNLEGPGITSHANDGNAMRGLIIAAALALLASTTIVRGRRRLVPVVGGVGLLAWVTVATLAPLESGSWGYGPGLYTAWADQPFGYSERVIYVFAPAGGHFSFEVFNGAASLVPARLDAVEAPYAHEVAYGGMTWTAVWLDREPDGGSTGPMTPFTPLDLPSYRSLWLVGRAAACANGPGFDPRREGSSFTGEDTVVVQVSVLGIPRRVQLPLGVSLVEPVGDHCPDPGSIASPSPAGSGER